IELPRPERRRARDEAMAPLHDALARAEAFFRRALRGAEGAQALAYLRRRNLADATIEAFGIGYAPDGGARLVEAARGQGITLDRLVEAGLARRDERGEARDFFRGRLTIPVRDLEGRTVGFGARRLVDGDPRVPKYINTPETPLFRKGRLIYALDLALEHVRRSGHLILVEGYTDVMAAHQAGVRTVVAVLGTATTDDHAALVRKSGARRVSLVFDGDDAGRRATYKALHGLLPLEIAIDVVRLEGEEDPADLVAREGAAGFERVLARALEWFAFLAAELAALPSPERWKHVDRVLELIVRLPRPIAREERLAELAQVLGVPVQGLREELESLPERRRERRAAAAPGAAGAAPKAATASANPDRALSAAYAHLAGAALLEPALAPRLEPFVGACTDPELRTLLAALVELAASGEPFSVDAVMSALGDDPARNRVVALLDDAERAESPRASFEEHVASLERRERERAAKAGAAEALELPSGSEESKNRLLQLHGELRRNLELYAARPQARP
ncbi:MAG TPA: toprim domain-containing protein, partial [Planctomycetota bacterium]|nr:toprim domain-containing protein [Planctomycetota bacterium]